MLKKRSGGCLAILGMGRSGTSALAGAMQLLGVDLGQNLIAPDELNPKGYFENAAAIALNASLLSSIGSYHSDFRCLDDIAWDAKPCAGHRKPILHFLQREFRDSPLFALKDPRLCRVWPVWARAIAQFGRPISFLLPLRHPVEVVQSLYSLGTSTNHGLLWWISYTLDAEKHSREAPRFTVLYKDLLAAPHRTLKNIASSLCLSWPEPWEQVRPALSGFLDPSMRHFSDSEPAVLAEADPKLLAFSRSLYRAVLTGPKPAGMDALRVRFCAIARSYSGWRFRIR